MAVKKQSEFLAKHGKKLQQAHSKHKDDATTYGPREVPVGIKNGIAKLLTVSIAQYKQGDLKDEYYIRFTASVVEPKVHNDIACEGIQFSLMEPLCDTPKSEKNPTFEHHIANVYNELRKLGVDTSTMEPSDLEETIADLEAVGPYFTFDSWAGKPTEQYPNPRTNINWNGIVDYAPDGNADVQDNTAPAEESNSGYSKPSEENIVERDTEESTESEEHEESEEQEKEGLAVHDVVGYKSSRNPDVRQYTIIEIDEKSQTVKIKEIDNPKAPVLAKVPISKLIIN